MEHGGNFELATLYFALRNNAAIFLTYCAPDCNELLCYFVNPDCPVVKSFENIKKALCDYLCPEGTQQLSSDICSAKQCKKRIKL